MIQSSTSNACVSAASSLIPCGVQFVPLTNSYLPTANAIGQIAITDLNMKRFLESQQPQLDFTDEGKGKDECTHNKTECSPIHTCEKHSRRRFGRFFVR